MIDQPPSAPLIDLEAKSDPGKWREVYSTNPGDYYAHTIKVDETTGALRFDGGGYVVGVASIREVVERLAAAPQPPREPIDSLLTFGRAESESARKAKDREMYQFYEGWCAALTRASATSVSPAPQPEIGVVQIATVVELLQGAGIMVGFRQTSDGTLQLLDAREPVTPSAAFPPSTRLLEVLKTPLRWLAHQPLCGSSGSMERISWREGDAATCNCGLNEIWRELQSASEGSK